MIDFTLTPAQRELQQRVRAFVADKVMPFEQDSRLTAHGPTDDLRRELNALARAEGLLAPHAPEQWGGMGLNHLDTAIAFEASGYSTLGPIAMHCAAPDEGNMNLMARIGTEAQQQRWLVPLVAADPAAYEILAWALEPGDAVAFSYKTAHGADGNLTDARRRAFTHRWLGDDARFADRGARTSPPFPGIDQQPGEELRQDWFPILWPRPEG